MRHLLRKQLGNEVHKHPHLGREVAAGPVEDGDGGGVGLPVFQHGHEFAFVDGAHRAGLQHVDDAGAGDGEVDYGFAVVDVQAAVRGVGVGFAVALEGPAGGSAEGGGEVADAVEAPEFARAFGAAVAGQVAGRGAGDETGFVDLAGDHGGVGELADAQDDVDLFFGEFGEAVVEGHDDLHFGVFVGEGGERGGDVEVAERGGDLDAQLALRAGLGLLEGGLEVVDFA